MKKGQETWEVLTDVIRSCREIIREGKAQLELNLAPYLKDKNSIFINTVIAKEGQGKPPFLIGHEGEYSHTR